MVSSFSARAPGSRDPQGAFRTATTLYADEAGDFQGCPHGQTKIIRRFALQCNKVEHAGVNRCGKNKIIKSIT